MLWYRKLGIQTAKRIQRRTSSIITKKCLWNICFIVSSEPTYPEKKRVSNLLICVIEVLVVEWNSSKKSHESQDETNPSNSKPIKKLIICSIKWIIYIYPGTYIKHRFKNKSNIKNSRMNTIEDNEKNSIYYRKKEHWYELWL